MDTVSTHSMKYCMAISHDDAELHRLEEKVVQYVILGK